MRTLIACLMLSCAAFAGAPDGHRYYRTVKIPGPGWYAAPVDAHLWAYSWGEAWAYDANGKPLPCEILEEPPLSVSDITAQPEVVDFKRTDSKAVLTLHIPHLIGPHQQLEARISQRYYPEVMLEGSSDGKEWKMLVEGDLFMLVRPDPVAIVDGPPEAKYETRVHRLSKMNLIYPPTDFPWLRLTLPLLNEIDLPELEDLQIQYLESEALSPWTRDTLPTREIERPLADLLAGPSEIAYWVEIPTGKRSAHAIEIETVQPQAAVKFSLWFLDSGRPTLLGAGNIWPPSKRIPLPEGVLKTPLMLTTKGASLEAATLLRPRSKILFWSNKSGAITIGYGGAEKRPHVEAPREHMHEALELVLGEVEKRPLALSPELASLGTIRTYVHEKPDRIWKIELPDNVAPGRWIALPLSESLLDRAQDSQVSWRLHAPDGEIPFSVIRDPMPVLLDKQTIRLSPDANDNNNFQAIWTWQRESTRAWSFLFCANKKPIQSSLSLEYFNEELDIPEWAREPSRPWHRVGNETEWKCDPWEESCALLMPTPVQSANKFRITVKGKTGETPTSIDAYAWGLKCKMVFPMPASTSTLKLVFAGNEPGPRYYIDNYVDVWRFAGDLPEARIVATITNPDAKRPWDRLLFIAGLVLAVAVLLYLIAKLLPRRQEG